MVGQAVGYRCERLFSRGRLGRLDDTAAHLTQCLSRPQEARGGHRFTRAGGDQRQALATPCPGLRKAEKADALEAAVALARSPERVSA